MIKNDQNSSIVSLNLVDLGAEPVEKSAKIWLNQHCPTDLTRPRSQIKINKVPGRKSPKNTFL
jgi:hypothetical protein